MTHELKAEKVIARPVNEVFQALKEGLLFMNCGADSGSIQIDFRVGGKYQIEFKNKTLRNFGEFLEIVPNKKIVFNWCQNFGPGQKPDTNVAIELFEDGSKTKLVLVRSGFKNEETKNNHQMGWNGGLNDITQEIETGRLRFVRNFPVSSEVLFETCKNPNSFFGIIGDVNRGTIDFRVGGKYQVPTKTGEAKGEFLEMIPNQKIKMSWLAGPQGPLDSIVTMTITKKEDGSSSLELIHDGLKTAQDRKAHRTGWEFVTRKMVEASAKA